MRLSLLVAPVLLLLGSCTDAGLYAASDQRLSTADRADLEGVACVPLAAGESFPVRVLFAIQGGEGVPREVVANVTESLSTLQDRYGFAAIRFGVLAFHTLATGLQGSFVPASGLQPAIARLNAYQEQGPVSLRAPLKLARSILSGAMQTECPGQVERTRYIVVLIVTSADTSCANPAYNAGLDSRCALSADGGSAGSSPEALQDCSVCELTHVTGQLAALTRELGAGEITLQPIYVRETADPLARAQVQAMARSGGAEVIETDPSRLDQVLRSLNFSAIRRPLTLKRVLLVNRSAMARGGELLADSDGDGLSDLDERALGTDPRHWDTDADGLSDGVEVRVGLPPQSVNQVSACSPLLDTDQDRLNDCEERVLGTESCMGDTDGDGLPDLTEFLRHANPLVSAGLSDFDGDGVPDATELALGSDLHSADLPFQTERGHRYRIEATDPTADGRACWRIRVENVSLVQTLGRANPPYADDPPGINDLYLHVHTGFSDRASGAGVTSLFLQQVHFDGVRREPAGTIPFGPEDLLTGF